MYASSDNSATSASSANSATSATSASSASSSNSASSASRANSANSANSGTAVGGTWQLQELHSHKHLVPRWFLPPSVISSSSQLNSGELLTTKTPVLASDQRQSVGKIQRE